MLAMDDDPATAAALATMFGVVFARFPIWRNAASWCATGAPMRWRQASSAIASIWATGCGGEAAISTATAARARLASEQADHIALKNAHARARCLTPRWLKRNGRVSCAPCGGHFSGVVALPATLAGADGA